MSLGQADPAPIATLVMTGGLLDGTEYPVPRLDRAAVLGSSMDCDVQILLGNIDAAHAALRCEGDTLLLCDVGSATGTFVNGEAIEGEHAIREGDEIFLGPPGAKGTAKLIVVRLSPQSSAGPSSPALDVSEAHPALDEHSQVPILTGTVIEEAEEVVAAPAVARPAPAVARQPPPPPRPKLTAPAPARPVTNTLVPSTPAPAASPAPRQAPPAPRAAPPPPTPYRADLPSIPLAPQADEPKPQPQAAAGFPSLRPAGSRRAMAAGEHARPALRRRPLSLPKLPVLPLVGVVAVLAAVALVVLGWRALTHSSASPRAAVAAGPLPPGSMLATAQAREIEPEVAMPGQRILIRGDGFSGQRVTVQVAGIASSSVETTTEGIRALVPDVALPEGSKTSVLVQAGTAPARSFDLVIGRLPLLLSVRPETGPPGQVVVIEGRGFDPEPAANAVTFGGEPALVLAAGHTTLDVVVPAVSTGEPEIPIVVRADGRTSSARAVFRLARNTGTGFRPRFFPAVVGEYPAEPFAFVSTELGPVLLLGGAGGSVAERAAQVAAALNGVVESATAAPAFEVRDGAQPAVGIVGNPRPLLTPTAADAAAYSKPWDGARGVSRRVTPAALARHWAALLQDYLGLFLFRQRPLQMLMLSARGRVLSEIYAEAGQRSPGEPMVPSRLVLPPPAGWAVALRKMALVVGSEAVRAAVVVEGGWQGEIDDPEQGSRAFKAQLQIEGGRLAGTLTTWAGAVELRSALREIGFERGSLRFTADLQGAPQRFVGTLQGETVSGTIERTGRPPLHFTMRYLE